MALKVARRGQIPPFIVMDVMRAAAERAAAGKDVIHLEVGQPSTGAPQGVIRAAHAALDAQPLGYTLAFGNEPLRQRIATHYKERYGVTVPAERIAVTVGSSGAFLLGFLAAFEPGDRVGIAAPGYPCYRHILTALNVESVTIPIDASTGFKLTVEALNGIENLDGLIVASPSNPTGGVLSAVEMKALIAWCKQRGVRLVSDEIYHGITYGTAATTAADAPEVITINSFSKYFSMTGWRLGWMVLPPDLSRPVEVLAQNMFISPPTLAQVAGLAAFDCKDELDANVARYARNRAILLNELPGAGFDHFAPADGAFYVYTDVSRYTNDAEAFCRRLLAETGVACTPGVDFDPIEGRRFMRLAYPGTEAEMVEAAKRLKAWKK
ncbi:MAG TPA: aminotransferase class I/II-fold pyridoxal phosphate-dependent enzyme [Magnetospirillaceae bacterium]